MKSYNIDELEKKKSSYEMLIQRLEKTVNARLYLINQIDTKMYNNSDSDIYMFNRKNIQSVISNNRINFKIPSNLLRTKANETNEQLNQKLKKINQLENEVKVLIFEDIILQQKKIVLQNEPKYEDKINEYITILEGYMRDYRNYNYIPSIKIHINQAKINKSHALMKALKKDIEEYEVFF